MHWKGRASARLRLRPSTEHFRSVSYMITVRSLHEAVWSVKWQSLWCISHPIFYCNVYIIYYKVRLFYKYKLRLHTAINRADFVSWWMWFNGSPQKYSVIFLRTCILLPTFRTFITCTKIRNRPNYFKASFLTGNNVYKRPRKRVQYILESCSSFSRNIMTALK